MTQLPSSYAARMQMVMEMLATTYRVKIKRGRGQRRSRRLRNGVVMRSLISPRAARRIMEAPPYGHTLEGWMLS